MKTPKSEVITMRVQPSLKRKAQKLPYTYDEILQVGCDHLMNESDSLVYKKGEIELELHELMKEVHEKEAHLTAINNRIRVIDPHKLDKDTLNNMIEESARDYAQSIFDRHGAASLKRLDIDQARHSVYSTAQDYGYDGNKFFNLVEGYLEKFCNTSV